jgi:UDP-N-acetylglucosamine diphosphorylase / glucose-1-phosphate thymidylyltransferase / UDP-N-acetylgalactosamine diphosphorylase / glucosamine-1-phosphate N-acetyltransferase / galactosamine-1-phosphate N-acetyltransferase
VKIILDDTKIKPYLYPFTATRHAADIRIGILTIREKWSYFPQFQIYTDTASFFAENPNAEKGSASRLEANIIPTKEWLDGLLNPLVKPGYSDIELIDTDKVKMLHYPWQIFQYNDWALRKDFEMIRFGRVSQPVSSTNKIICGENIFLEDGAIVEHSILNASTGPIYIGKNAQVQEGCMIRGAFALCESAVLKMGSKVYGATTIGPHCNAAGEIKNSVIFGYSNKAHDGYLGDSVIGEWCNLGAGTTNSNVKNTGGEVKVWSNAANDYLPAGLKCGLLMGDYSRSAINTSFNTGTVIGVCCNIFGVYFPPKFAGDFTWGKERYTFEKVLQDISNWKKLKGMMITEHEKKILKQLYTQY